MDWSATIDAYCERTSPEFWAEPLNAISNLSFLLAAAYGLILARKTTPPDRLVLALSLIAAAVGIGSFLFHTIATRWASLADVIPIAIFIAVGFGGVIHRLAGVKLWWTIGLTAVFMAGSPALARSAEPILGSSAGYLPALLALLLIGGWLVRQGVSNGRFVLAAGLVFAVSLTFRMADQPFCDTWPMGTHVGWHLLNGVVLALVIRAVAVFRGVQSSPAVL